MALIAGAWFLGPRWPEELALPLRIAGAVVGLAGVALVGWARRTLGPAFTAFPEPRAGGGLVTRGPYRLVRHPMYGGALLLFGGLSLVRSISCLVPTAALAVLWWRKSIVEERRLAARYPEYDAYRGRTPRRFLPFIA